MKITYMKAEDTLYINFTVCLKKKKYKKTQGEWPILAHFSEDGKLIEITIVGAGNILDTESLNTVSIEVFDRYKERFGDKPLTAEIIMNKIILLLEKFVAKEINGSLFEKEYMELWMYIRDKKVRTNEKAQEILDELWSDVDCYESDPKLLAELRSEDSDMARQGMYLDEDQLRALAKEKLKKLKKLLQTMGSEDVTKNTQ